jgi:hypothetical protein
MLKRTSKFPWLAWAVCGVLGACGGDQKLSAAAGESGASGEPRGTGGDADVGVAGTPTQTHATGGRSDRAGGAAGGIDVSQAGQGTGGRVEPSGGASGGDTGGRGIGGRGAMGGRGGQGTGGAGGSTAGGRSATAGEAGQSTDGGAPSSGLPGSNSFSKLTVRAVNPMGMYLPTSPEDECSMADESVRSVDRSSRTLNWEYCRSGPPTQIERGSRTLSEAELQAVHNTLSLVVPYTGTSCGADGPVLTLEFEVDGSSTSYTDDTFTCYADPSTNRIRQAFPLYDWLGVLTPALAIPATPGTLSVNTGVPLTQTPPEQSECWDRFVPQFEVDVATGRLSWDYCATPAEAGDFTVVTGSRVLGDTELASVLRAYDNLEIGASSPCDALSPPASYRAAWVQIDDGPHLIDESGSCSDEAEGAYAIGVPELVGVVEGLVP